MSSDSRYLVYRKYSQKERYDPSDRVIFYGWTSSKKMLDMFLEQRSVKKYKVRKVDIDEIQEEFDEILDSNTMLNFVELKSAQDEQDYVLVMTEIELRESEKKVARLFDSLSDMDEAKDNLFEVLKLFVNLTDEYANALDFLGFRPAPLEALFPGADLMGNCSVTQRLEDSIDEEYEYSADFSMLQPVTPSIAEDISKQIIYSLEAFIKVLRDDM